MAKKLPEIHPGEILSEEFIKPMGITNARLASDLDVPTSRISEIVNGASSYYRRYSYAFGGIFQHGSTLLVEFAGGI